MENNALEKENNAEVKWKRIQMKKGTECRRKMERDAKNRKRTQSKIGRKMEK